MSILLEQIKILQEKQKQVEALNELQKQVEENTLLNEDVSKKLNLSINNIIKELEGIEIVPTVEKVINPDTKVVAGLENGNTLDLEKGLTKDLEKGLTKDLEKPGACLGPTIDPIRFAVNNKKFVNTTVVFEDNGTKMSGIVKGLVAPDFIVVVDGKDYYVNYTKIGEK